MIKASSVKMKMERFFEKKPFLGTNAGTQRELGGTVVYVERASPDHPARYPA
jgi:hypothetical protein